MNYKLFYKQIAYYKAYSSTSVWVSDACVRSDIPQYLYECVAASGAVSVMMANYGRAVCVSDRLGLETLVAMLRCETTIVCGAVSLMSLQIHYERGYECCFLLVMSWRSVL